MRAGERVLRERRGAVDPEEDVRLEDGDCTLLKLMAVLTYVARLACELQTPRAGKTIHCWVMRSQK